MADTKTDTDKDKSKAPPAIAQDTRFQIAVDVFTKMARDLHSNEEANAKQAFRAADAFIAQYHAR